MTEQVKAVHERNPNAPSQDVSSTLRVKKNASKFRPTMPNWVNIALSVLAGKSLTRGQVANEAILFDRTDYEVADTLSGVEDGVIESLNASLEVEVDEELVKIADAHVDDVQEDWIAFVNESDSYVNPEGKEQTISTRGESKAERCGLYLINEHKPASGSFGPAIERSLSRILSSPWNSRSERLSDLQTIQMVVSSGSWQVVSDDRDTDFVEGVRQGQYELSQAVESALDDDEEEADDGSNEGENDYWEMEDGQVTDITARQIPPEELSDVSIKNGDVTAEAVRAASRHEVAEGEVFLNEDDKMDLVESVITDASDYQLDRFSSVVEEGELYDARSVVVAAHEDNGVEVDRGLPIDFDPFTGPMKPIRLEDEVDADEVKRRLNLLVEVGDWEHTGALLTVVDLGSDDDSSTNLAEFMA